jgi:dTDP-glucose pyrophosphorylase
MAGGALSTLMLAGIREILLDHQIPGRHGLRLVDARSRTLRHRGVRRIRACRLHRGEAQAPTLVVGGTAPYFYDTLVIDIAAGLAPSALRELKINDVNAAYLKN